MTERLYLADPHLTRFKAKVLSTPMVEGRAGVVLDRTAFYVEGGGQPADHGALGAAKVVDVQELEGQVVHLVDRPLEAGTEVEGVVDWLRRRDHMQQHHGQHLLSAAFARVCQAPTVSFHLGPETSTIDLEIDASRLTDEALRRAEAETNRIIWEDLPVIARDFVGEERKALTLRKEAVKGDRVVVVVGFDASPCGGTHPLRTGEVGSVVVLEGRRWGNGKTRVEFVCGSRVVMVLTRDRAQLAGTAEALKCPVPEVMEASKRLAGDLVALRKQSEALLEQVVDARAAQLDAGAPAGAAIVEKVQLGTAGAKALALSLAKRGRVALIASVEGDRAQLAFARPRGEGASMRELLAEATTVMKGKGGGSPELAQGSGEAARVDVALEQLRQKLKGGVGSHG